MSASTTTLADRLVQARTGIGLSQEDVAKSAGMTQQSYSDLERGVSKRSTRIGSLSHVLGVDAYWLETGNGRPGQVPNEPRVGALDLCGDEDIMALVALAQKMSRKQIKGLLVVMGNSE